MSYLVLIANALDDTISTLRLHGDVEPGLELLATSPGGKGNAALAVDPVRDLVYATAKADTDAGTPPAIVILQLDRASGRLTEVARKPVEDGLAYLDLAHDGSLLVGGSYNGDFGAVWPVSAEGLWDPVSRIEHKHVHCSYVNGDVVYFVALGDDAVAQYRIAEDGTLTALDPEIVGAPAGSGPRHIVTSGDHAYLVTEYSGEVIRFDISDEGVLSRDESVNIVKPDAGLSHSRLGADPEEEDLIWGADVHVTDALVLASERMASTIATVELEDSTLGKVVGWFDTEKQPRGFNVTPDGRHVVAVGEKSDQARLSRIEDDGTLTDITRVQIGNGANWVRFIAS